MVPGYPGAMHFLIFLVSGSAIGVISSMIGIGGGSFIVPLLVLGGFVGSAQEAVGTSIAGVLFMGLSASLAYGRSRTGDLFLALWTAPAAILTSWGSAALSGRVESRGILVAFGVFLALMGLFMAFGKTPKELSGAPKRLLPYPYGGLLVGALAGITAGLFGLGGGTIMVPGFAFLLGAELHTAVATSLLVMIPSAGIATIQHALSGNTHWELVLPLALGIIVGAQIGPRIAQKLPQGSLRRIFSLALFYAAYRMISEGLG
ncbi:TPA: sulfite exporter TauE/SafE family protein [Candidatus Micrarchaeota archaeon]|nr:sulfite exporter TauE/SafE family protein [Candidatus Micrarchaeota archaeon]